MFITWWRLQDIFTTNNLLFYLSEEFYITEQKLLNASICLFQPFGKIKIAGSYEDKPTLDLRKSQRHSSSYSCRYNVNFKIRQGEPERQYGRHNTLPFSFV